MPLRVACQMDPIQSINPKGDSTFALLLEAQARGHEVWVYEPRHMSLRGAVPVATVTRVRLKDTPTGFAEIVERASGPLAHFDVVLLRQDPPFDMAYITTTHMLEQLQPGTLVVNDPAGVRNAPEKLFLLAFPDLMPPTLITRDLAEVETFYAEHGDVILKPLYGNGGRDVFRVGPGDANLSALAELFERSWREPYIVQQYRPEVARGDKRLILVDGEYAGGINRVPAKGQVRSNLRVGGTAEPVALTERDREICARLAPELKRRGLVFTGIDVIGAYLTEINVTSPTGIRQVKAFGGADIAALIWDAIEGRAAARGARQKQSPA